MFYLWPLILAFLGLSRTLLYQKRVKRLVIERTRGIALYVLYKSTYLLPYLLIRDRTTTTLRFLALLLRRLSYCERKFHNVFALGNESSMTFSLLGTKVPRHFRSRERKFHVIFAPGNESSIHRTFVPGNESSWEWKFLLPLDGPKRMRGKRGYWSIKCIAQAL